MAALLLFIILKFLAISLFLCSSTVHSLSCVRNFESAEGVRTVLEYCTIGECCVARVSMEYPVYLALGCGRCNVKLLSQDYKFFGNAKDARSKMNKQIAGAGARCGTYWHRTDERYECCCQRDYCNQKDSTIWQAVFKIRELQLLSDGEQVCPRVFWNFQGIIDENSRAAILEPCDTKNSEYKCISRLVYNKEQCKMLFATVRCEKVSDAVLIGNTDDSNMQSRTSFEDKPALVYKSFANHVITEHGTYVKAPTETPPEEREEDVLRHKYLRRQPLYAGILCTISLTCLFTILAIKVNYGGTPNIQQAFYDARYSMAHMMNKGTNILKTTKKGIRTFTAKSTEYEDRILPVSEESTVQVPEPRKPPNSEGDPKSRGTVLSKKDTVQAPKPKPWTDRAEEFDQTQKGKKKDATTNTHTSVDTLENPLEGKESNDTTSNVPWPSKSKSKPSKSMGTVGSTPPKNRSGNKEQMDPTQNEMKKRGATTTTNTTGDTFDPVEAKRKEAKGKSKVPQPRPPSTSKGNPKSKDTVAASQPKHWSDNMEQLDVTQKEKKRWLTNTHETGETSEQLEATDWKDKTNKEQP